MSDGPQGAAVLVWRRTVNDGREWLILHRAHNGSDYEGDWAWTPPSGVRDDGEDAASCALRELREETGLDLDVELVDESTQWAVFVAEAPSDADVSLNFEHDRYESVSADEAERRCLPPNVGTAFRVPTG